MPDAPDHDVEPSLFAALASHGALAFEPAAAFNEVTALAARLCQTPMAALGFAHTQRQWCQSSHGVSLAGTQREPSFLTPGLAQKGMLVVPDAVNDPRFCKDPITIGGEPLRFYASVPITVDEDRGLGVLCVLDHQPREAGLSDDQRTHLQSLAQLTLRVAKLHHAYLIERASLRESVHRTRNIISVVQALVMRTLTSASSQEEAASTLM
ncbi:MAG: GAF domain-containing protein, partial [Pseudomonadota bacterium]